MILRFEGVSYRYPGDGPWCLQDLDLSVAPGESVVLAGASGSGKSTLCRAAAGLVPHFHGGVLEGRVLVDGLDTRENPLSRLFGRAGLVFQNADAQLFNSTVEAELAYGLESLGLPPSEIERRLSWASGIAGFDPLLQRPPQALSGGEKQRVALAAILALRPPLLLLDEPFTHLDPEESERLCGLLRAVRSEGITLVLVEHRLHDVVAEVDRLILLDQGRVGADGPPREVLSRDVSAFGLNVPPLVRLFREWGIPGAPPLTVEEALQELGSSAQGRAFPAQGPAAPGTPGLGSAEAAVSLEKVWFRYGGREALRDVDMGLHPGECVALVGRNGAGKTTLVKHLNGLLRPASGRVRVLGQDTLRTPVAALARHVGFAWQNPNDQLFQANVREEVLTGPRVLGGYDASYCDQLFDRFGLGPLLERSPFRLSEGQKKRVAFATALAARPEVVVLDEPTAGQDEAFRGELGRLLVELRRDGKTVILVTHDLEFASEHAGRWVALSAGQVVADGPPESVMADQEAMAAAGLRPTHRFRLLRALTREAGGNDGVAAAAP